MDKQVWWPYTNKDTMNCIFHLSLSQNERLTEEQNKADERVMHLADEQKASFLFSSFCKSHIY